MGKLTKNVMLTFRSISEKKHGSVATNIFVQYKNTTSQKIVNKEKYHKRTSTSITMLHSAYNELGYNEHPLTIRCVLLASDSDISFRFRFGHWQ